jgi:hypothetical protein
VTHDKRGVKAWLLLAFELPAQPTAARMRAWRQLKRIGALPLKSGVYALPDAPQQREDFEWLLTEVIGGGGQGFLFGGAPLDPSAEAGLVHSFRTDRQREFETLRKEAEQLRGRRRAPRSPARTADRRQAAALSERLRQLESLDFFGSPGRAEARAAVEALHHVKDTAMPSTHPAGVLKPSAFERRTWVTRPRPGIDRFASAWFIRRFIDRRARFVFADSLDAAAAAHPRAIPFDMFGAEFGHQGRDCTFETLARRFDVRDPGVTALARIVHALDLKDEAPVAFDAVILGQIVEGLRQVHADDAELLERGMDVIEALYRSPVATDPPAPRRRRKERA